MVLRYHRKGSLNYGGDNLVLEDEDLYSLHDEDEDDENSQVLNPGKFNSLPKTWNISEHISQGKTLCFAYSDKRVTQPDSPHGRLLTCDHDSSVDVVGS